MSRDHESPRSIITQFREHVIDELVVFSRVLRDAGVAVPTNATITAAHALVEVGFRDEATVRAALRSVLVTREEDLATFDQLFPVFWQRFRQHPVSSDDEASDGDDIIGGAVPRFEQPDPADSVSGESGRDGLPDDVERLGSIESRVTGFHDESESVGGEAVSTSVYSPTGQSAVVSVGPQQLERDEGVSRAVSQLTRAIAEKQGRRWTSGGHERVDTRRALRQSVGTGGAVISLPGKERDQTVVQACLLVDVSQSVLDTVDRGFLVEFLRSVSESWRTVRIFFFDTSVRDVTSAFDARTPRSAVDALRQAEAEWGGGTRIGNAIETVRRETPTAVDRDTVVFVISDGLEVGELGVLEAGMSWLSRKAASVLWLNPLAGSSEYEPTCRGMEIALPFVNGVFAFTDHRDIEEIARQVDRHGVTGPIGYQYDHRRGD